MPAREYPFYIKAPLVLLGLTLIVYMLLALGDILVPFAFAALIAILLNPLCNILQRRGVPKIGSIIISLLITVVFVGGIFYLLSTQLAQFGETLPQLKIKLDQLIQSLEHQIFNRFGVAINRQVQFVKSLMDSSQALLGRTLNTVLGTLSIIFLIPVYVFMMLYYKELILNFLYEVFAEEHSQRVGEILKETKNAIQSYVVGLLIEMLFVAVLNSTALIILGVKYGILLGVIGAILNMLPYIGGIIAIGLPVLMATVTKDGYSTQLEIIVAYILIQFIDNNIIFPRFVSLKVKINALVSIIVVLMGNALWGVSGMFLSIPFVAVLKIIFDRVDDLKPWGKLLGDTVPVKDMAKVLGRRKAREIQKEAVETGKV